MSTKEQILWEKKRGVCFGIILQLSLFLVLYSCGEDYVLSDSIPTSDHKRSARVLSAFFGLDNDLPRSSVGISPKAPGKDGMPVVFSHEINPETLEASDFIVRTSSGREHPVEIVTLKPASEAFELRTALLIGEFGNYPDDEPVEVEISGELLARSGQNYQGQKIAVTSLEKGPFLSYAEYFTIDDLYPYVEKGNGCDCPKEETTVVARTVWSGGVRALNDEELGDDELENFTVYLVHEKDTLRVHPFALADLEDNDNNIDLCVRQPGIPFAVAVDENTAIDPRNDPNEFTEIEVNAR